jgi:hypothetical protein
MLARLVVTMPVPLFVVGTIVGGVVAALTGRIGRHSTTGLAVVSAAGLPAAQLDESIRGGHPEFGSERSVVARPVREHSLRAWLRPVMVFCHGPYATVAALLIADPGGTPA